MQPPIPTPTRSVRRLSWTCQLLAALILGQTLFFKFTGAEESRFIFAALGLEPWGRIGSGAAELVAVVLLLWPPAAALGALLGLGILAGAIATHLFVLGIEVQGDGGLLFALAVAAFAACAAVAWVRRAELQRLRARWCAAA